MNLDHSPLKLHISAQQSYVEFKTYMSEMRDATASRLRNSSIANSATSGSLLENFVRAGTPDLRHDDLSISPAAVLGNMFIFILAGHETSANTLTHALTLLALNPYFQSRLQTELDDILGNSEPDSWSYLDHFPRLLNGCVGALMSETLRLYTVLQFYPKTNPVPQTVVVEGRQHVIPKDTLILINTSAAHRHPKYWPPPHPTPQKKDGDAKPYPVSEFAPHRWLNRPNSDNVNPKSDDEEKEQNEGEEPWNPEPGAYIPFAEGFRSCMGSRFAKVEFCAVVARIMREFSVELADKGDEGIEEARKRMSEGMGIEMGLKMKRAVPLRFVKRRL